MPTFKNGDMDKMSLLPQFSKILDKLCLKHWDYVWISTLENMNS